MLQISVFLERFKRFTRPDILVREKASDIIFNETGVKIEEKKISFKNGVVLISTYDPILKSEIFLKKQRILNSLRELSGDKNITDIR